MSGSTSSMTTRRAPWAGELHQKSRRHGFVDNTNKHPRALPQDIEPDAPEVTEFDLEQFKREALETNHKKEHRNAHRRQLGKGFQEKPVQDVLLDEIAREKSKEARAADMVSDHKPIVAQILGRDNNLQTTAHVAGLPVQRTQCTIEIVIPKTTNFEALASLGQVKACDDMMIVSLPITMNMIMAALQRAGHTAKPTFLGPGASIVSVSCARLVLPESNTEGPTRFFPVVKRPEFAPIVHPSADLATPKTAAASGSEVKEGKEEKKEGKEEKKNKLVSKRARMHFKTVEDAKMFEPLQKYWRRHMEGSKLGPEYVNLFDPLKAPPSGARIGKKTDTTIPTTLDTLFDKLDRDEATVSLFYAQTGLSPSTAIENLKFSFMGGVPSKEMAKLDQLKEDIERQQRMIATEKNYKNMSRFPASDCVRNAFTVAAKVVQTCMEHFTAPDKLDEAILLSREDQLPVAQLQHFPAKYVAPTYTDVMLAPRWEPNAGVKDAMKKERDAAPRKSRLVDTLCMHEDDDRLFKLAQFARSGFGAETDAKTPFYTDEKLTEGLKDTKKDAKGSSMADEIAEYLMDPNSYLMGVLSLYAARAIMLKGWSGEEGRVEPLAREMDAFVREASMKLFGKDDEFNTGRFIPVPLPDTQKDMWANILLQPLAARFQDTWRKAVETRATKVTEGHNVAPFLIKNPEDVASVFLSSATPGAQADLMWVTVKQIDNLREWLEARFVTRSVNLGHEGLSLVVAAPRTAPRVPLRGTDIRVDAAPFSFEARIDLQLDMLVQAPPKAPVA